MQRGILLLFAPENPATLVLPGFLGLGYDRSWLWCLVALVVPCDSSVKKPGLSWKGFNHGHTGKTSGELPEIYVHTEQGAGNFALLLLLEPSVSIAW